MNLLHPPAVSSALEFGVDELRYHVLRNFIAHYFCPNGHNLRVIMQPAKPRSILIMARSDAESVEIGFIQVGGGLEPGFADEDA